MSADELSLPPIMRPLLNKDLKQFDRGKSTTGKLRTAEQNFKRVIEAYPQPTQNMLNIKYKDYYYDPFEKEPHRASRVISSNTPM